jgi:Cu2+-exporting ATPase
VSEEKDKIYFCPMHPEVREVHPGLCPDCGMSLVPGKKENKHIGHGAHDSGGSGFNKHVPLEASHPWRLPRQGRGPLTGHAGHSTNVFKTKFWVSLLLSVPVLAYSDVVPKIFGWRAPNFPGSVYLPFALSSIIFFYGGWIFIAGAWRELHAKLPGMMTLIGLAVSTAYAYSVYSALTGRGETLFWELSTLITVMLLGHWLEMRAIVGAQGALRELSKLLPDTAEKVNGDRTEVVALANVREGDVLLVRPGAKIPADGVVVWGMSDVNEALATGESRPVIKKEGGEVIAGTINGDGSLKIKVTKIGERTFLAGVMRLVKEAQASKSRLQLLSDKAAFYLTIVAVLTGIFTLIWWLAAKAGSAFAVERFVAVLVIACPHALGLAIPLVASISTTKAAKSGFLVRQRLALESARKVDVVLFDKTGTLTSGEYGITNIWPTHGASEEEILRLAASVDAHSEHPISKAIVEDAKKRGIQLSEIADFARLPGRGARGVLGGKEIIVGGAAILGGGKFLPPADVEEESKKGRTIIYVLQDKKVRGVLALADIPRAESREAVRDLRKAGVRVAMITGDSEDVARSVAQDLGIDEFFARVLPQEKSEKVKILQAGGKRVAMVGDGINDAPALTQADLGVAIGAGTNVAIESAGIILVKNDPRDIAKIIKLSKLTYNKMVENLFWATGYNVIAIPLAAGVLASRGILLQPALSALLMSVSTVIVAVNALLLRKADLSR